MDGLPAALRGALCGEGSLRDGLFAVDAYIGHASNVEAAQLEFSRLVDAAKKVIKAESTDAHIAAAVLQLLEASGFKYDDDVAAHGSVASDALNSRRFSCLSLTLIVLALLEALGREAYWVELPRHCFLRAKGGTALVNIECTAFGVGRQDDWYEAKFLPKSAERGHYLGNLSATDALWHYCVDAAYARASSDARILLPLLLSYGASIPSRCVLLDKVEAACLTFAAMDPEKGALIDAGKLDRAEALLSRLIILDPAEPLYAINMATCRGVRNDKRGVLGSYATFIKANAARKDDLVLHIYLAFIRYRLQWEDEIGPLRRSEVEFATSFLEKWGEYLPDKEATRELRQAYEIASRRAVKD